MAEINSINNRPVTLPADNSPAGNVVNRIGQDAGKGVGAPHASPDAPIGQPGPLGQPTGMPAPTVPGGGQLLSDVLTGRESSQMRAAEKMRETGGATATEKLLGLDQQPSLLGAFPAPPGNREALRHLSPATRRGILVKLLAKQRGRVRNLARALRDSEKESSDEREGDGEGQSFSDELLVASTAPNVSDQQRERAGRELGSVAQMLDLIDELLIMQEYTLSQMGTFAHG